MTKIFISYSHDSQLHSGFVRELSDKLRHDGLDCFIDQYENGAQPEGWQRWMENQIEASDFVLLMCTENYLRRYRGQETQGGKGVTFEGVVISQTLYDHYYHNTKFIPVIPADGSWDNVPIALKVYSTYTLLRDYDKLYRVLTAQTEYVPPVLGSIRPMPASNTQAPHRIHSDRLPTVKGAFFGRIAELQMLNDAWAGNDSRIIQFIAPGGTGKTKLLRQWLDHTTGIDTLLAWSFYSQGAGENKQISATPFFIHAFQKLGSTRTSFTTEEDRGEHLAELLQAQRSVLVLDGLEPLQHAGRGMLGELKDRAIRQLLKSLASHNNGLCIITTRIAVHELSDRAHVVRHELQNLVPADGMLLLQSLGVRGRTEELHKAAQEYRCHALALSLLGNLLRLRYQGDVLKRDTLKELSIDVTGSKESRHAFKVMQSYQEWFAGEPELALLHLLGLFDHPVSLEVLMVLWAEQIPHLTAGIEENTWLEAIDALREEHHLLAQYDGLKEQANDLDCHPLIREYFGQQLKYQQPNAWQQAHKTLYNYYKTLPAKELPDTLDELQPLFCAVAHGCAAGLHQQVLDEVYWPRVRRKNEAFIVKKLGAFSDDLAALAHFFTIPWQTPVLGLGKNEQALLLSWVGYRLRALGRLREALAPMHANIEMYVKLENWTLAAVNANNLSELQLSLGEISEAKASSHLSMEYANKSGVWQPGVNSLTTQADILHHMGNTSTALVLFREAEKLQQEHQPYYSRLYSARGFFYCDLLLAICRTAEVVERAGGADSQMGNATREIVA